MKKIGIVALIALFSFGSLGLGQAQEKPEKSDNGIWIKKYQIKGVDKKFYYAVDSVTQQCFSIVRIGMGAGHTPIPCEKLKRRPEWEKIIFWN